MKLYCRGYGIKTNKKDENVVEKKIDRQVVDPEGYKNLINRLNRIEGQVRGLKNMLDNGAESTEVLIQTSAVKAALSSFSKALFAEYVNLTAVDKIKNDDEYIITELIDTFYKLAK